MKTNMMKTHNSGWKRRVSLVLIYTMLLSMLMYHGFLKAQEAHAAISQQSGWASQYASNVFPNGAVNASYAIADGSNRLLVVAVASTRTAAGALTCSASYGGVNLLSAADDSASTTTWNHSFLFYLKDTDIGSASGGKSLNVTCTASGGSSYYTYVYAAVYAGVDQNSPFTDARNYNSATANNTIGPFSPGLSINANDQAVEVINLARSTSGTTARTISTWATGWTTAGTATAFATTTGPTLQLYIRDRNLLTSATDTSQHTSTSSTIWDSMTAMSIKVLTCSDTDPATLTTTNPAASGDRKRHVFDHNDCRRLSGGRPARSYGGESNDYGNGRRDL